MADILAPADDWPVDTAGVGVTDAEATLELRGAVDTVLPFASVTKPLAAYAVLVAVQDGVVHLDEPAGPEGATVRHLLAHAAGLSFDGTGPTGAPGRRRMYSNVGYDLLGDLVAERVGTPFAEHLAHEVLDPLGMHDTVLDGSPAKDGRGTVVDLLAFCRELLAPTLLDSELAREATTVAFPGLDGVLPGHGRQQPNDWGLGFEIKDGKQPHWTGAQLSAASFGHFGQSGSFVIVDPEAGVGLASLADRPFGDWCREAWPTVQDAAVAAYGR
ncbi:serine hydrolase domain-containing protein [Egicoccus halophilus]|uniref:Serine hydrolase n=1 Tax=Egicoccus halophilus TaxID=1670830 RepID=A0A8J3A9Y7_9ACTN|nr:serine hydrolase domain-containing protein [Egicoccus halophilus]GGI08042.1 serine hydrolase [Egicoccus halophilus]